MKKNIHIIFSVMLLTSLSIASAQNTWSKQADYGGGERERAVGFSIGGRGYVGTGQDTANAMKKDFWEYDPATNSWAQKADFPGVGRRDAIGFAIGNKGYIGTGMNNPVSYFGVKQKDLYEYNPVTNTWTSKANWTGNFNSGVYYASGFATSTKGYLCTGKFGFSYYSNQLWQYNPVTNTWAQKAAFPGGVRYGAAAFAIGDKGYVGCGADENIYRKDFYEYNEATNTWTAKADFPGSARFNPAGFSIGERGYIGLGTDGGYQRDLYEYNPATDIWQQRANFPTVTGRRSVFAFTIGNYAYVGTGKGDGVKRSMYRYEPYVPGPEKSQPENIVTKIFPNPVSDAATISLNKNENINSAILVILDNSGNSVYTSNEMINSQFIFNRKNLAGGIYYYTITITDNKNAISHTAGKFLIL